MSKLQQTTAAPVTAATQEPSAAPSITLPTLATLAEQAFDVLMPSRPEAPQTEPASPAPQQSSWDWVKEKVGSFARSAVDHFSRLQNIHDFSSLCSWVRDAAVDLWSGIKQTAHEFFERVNDQHGEAHAHENEASIREAHAEDVDLALSLEGYDLSDGREEREQQIEAYYDAIREWQHGKKHESLGHDETHDALFVAPAFLDRKIIGELMLAVLTNKVPPECMVEVRRFLAHLAAEEHSKVA